MIVFEIDANVVRPGWTPLIITIVLAVVMVFLYRSMRHQFGRIGNLPTEREVRSSRTAAKPQAASPTSPLERSETRAESTGPTERRPMDVGRD